MWETFISWYINNYLGKYVENLNSQQLSFALRQGELELENVPLKKNIFRSWGLPIEVTSGIVGRIKIEFNLLKYFRNEPVLITIENVYLVAVPLNLAEWDPVQEAALAHEIKMSALDSHEGRWKTQFDLASNASSYYSSLYFSSMQIGASIVTKVVENLQLNVRNVHIRFEDVKSNFVVAVGITLKSLIAQSCDAAWTPLSTSSTGNNSDCSFKTLQLTEFGIYCDTTAKKFSDLSPVDLISAMDTTSRTHEYLLRPVSAEARISKNNSAYPISSSTKPRFDVQLSLNTVPFQLSEAQFRTAFRSYKSYSRLYRNCRFRHYRPFVESVKEAPFLWWTYAVRAILAHRGYKRRTVLKTYEEMATRATENVAFVAAYEKYLKQEMLLPEERKLKDRMEAELHFDEIVALRQVAMRRVEVKSNITLDKEKILKESAALSHKEEPSTTDPNATVESSTSYGRAFSYIFPSWSNWVYSANTTTASSETAPIDANSEEFENEIIQLRKSESELDESILDDMKSYGRDAVLARFKFVLEKAVITLHRQTKQFLEMDFCDVNISTEVRPRTGAHKFNMSLAALSLRDCSTKSLIVSPHSTFPTTVAGGKRQDQRKPSFSNDQIFKLVYERRPHRKAGHRISITTKPLDLVIYPGLWNEVSSFFEFSDVEEDYLEVSQNRYEIMKEKTKEELRTYWKRLISTNTNSITGGHHSNWEITLDIAAPQIVIHGIGLLPTTKNIDNNTRPKCFRRVSGNGTDINGVVPKFIVFDLGRFRFTNDTDHEHEEEDCHVSACSDLLSGQEIDDDENEEFLTPCSSPVPERMTSDGDSCSSRPSIFEAPQNIAGIAFTESLDQLQTQLYKKYKLEITDIQITVVDKKSPKDESWRIANSQCTSFLHVVDRFSINLQLGRRVVYTEDPEWPTLTVMATLPELNFHFNKAKIHTLYTILRSYLPSRQNDEVPTKSDDDSISISATFEIPNVVVELVLQEELKVGKDEIPHLSLSCSDLSFECEKTGLVTEMKVSLKSLILEDTSVPKESQYRLLAMSQSSEAQNTSFLTSSSLLSSVFHRNPNISESCPDLISSSPINIPGFPLAFQSSCARTETSSLPDHLDPNDIFSERFHQHGNSKNLRASSKLRLSRSRVRPQSRRRQSVREYRSPSTPSDSCPATPPPSPRPVDLADNLVTIQITLVDRKSPLFLTKYKGVHKTTNVEFNTLDLVLTPDTFICLRKFFSEAFSHADFESESERHSPLRRDGGHGEGMSKRHSISSPLPDRKEDLETNSEVEINVKALRVKLADFGGTLAEAEVTDVMCRIVNQGNYFHGIDGHMGSLTIKDKTPYAGKYPIKFSFQGRQALNFDYCRRENEAKFRLEMASVLYIHTHRFYTEFHALITLLFGSTGFGGSETDTGSCHGPDEDIARVVLNIQAGAPVIFLPYSSTTSSLLVADLGHLSVRNKFLKDRDASKVFDYISVELVEMDLYSAELRDADKYKEMQVPEDGDRKSWVFDGRHTISKTTPWSSLLRNKCALNLKIKRLLNRRSQTNPTQASMSIQGTLSAVHATVNLEKYKLICGLLEYNIGEQFPPRAMQPASYYHHHRLHSSKLSSSMITRHSIQAANSVARVELLIELDLLNVTVEVLKAGNHKLCKVDFTRSKFTFQNYSDGTRDIDLASQEIMISDIRVFPEATTTTGEGESNRRNVFKNILQQSSILEAKRKGGAQHQPDDQSSSHHQSKLKLRAEVHLRETKRGSNVTILLNSMRLMLILDWWIEVQAFLSQNIPEPSPLQVAVADEVPSWNDTQFGNDKRYGSISPRHYQPQEVMQPVTISAGIVTKRAAVLNVPQKTFDFKLNICDCELVVVEDTSAWDTNAVILKMTATLTWRPYLERPISCNIMESELFSCVLGIETGTALSILDPTNVCIEVVRKTKDVPPGIMDATLPPSSTESIVRIQSSQISLRLSYYDMKMFLQLLERFSKDAQVQLKKRPSQLAVATTVNADFGNTTHRRFGSRRYHANEDSVQHLLSMGFPHASCVVALSHCHGRVEDAAFLLISPTNDFMEEVREFEERIEQTTDTENYNEKKQQTENLKNEEAESSAICGIEVKCTNVSICIIDDCKDVDVPLTELNLSGLEVHQDCTKRSAKAEATITADYYNRDLGGWEPLLEAWKCFVNVQRNERGQLGRQTPSSEFPTKAPELEISLSSHQVMNINVTSTLLSLYKTVSSKWSSEYGHQVKRRSPFVPFILKNETGSVLWFCTVISCQEDILKQPREGTAHADGTSWIQVDNGATQTFIFEGRGKLRHRNTHQLKMHQLIVRVNGWLDCYPVSVDRVGTYFREIIPISNIPSHYGTEMANLPTTRLVFDVSLQGSAQKLVRIRSALMVKNTLLHTMELKLENTIIYPAFEMIQTGGSYYCIYVPPLQTCPIPLHSVCSQIWIRPIVGTEQRETIYSYCSKPLPLGKDSEGLRTCTSQINSQIQPYRFCVAVKRDEFPTNINEPTNYNRSLMCNNVAIGLAKRANLISILSPLMLVNLLPFEVAFEIKENGKQSLSGHIAAGKEFPVTQLDTTEPLEVTFSTENFPTGTSVVVNANSSSFLTRLKLLDTQKRALYLIAKVSREEGGTIIIRVSCQYWMVNKSGLPLMIKQEGVTAEAAGQFQENEHARMIVPLLFSFADPEGGTNVTMRVGTGLHPAPAKPHWCRPYPLQNGTRVRKLIVGLPNSQPEVVYLTGIEVTDGKGRYRDSKIVTIAPRFIIENRSSWRMQISQRNFATSFHDPAAEGTYLTLPPACTLPFHWPRLDKDELLCVRLLDFPGGTWSGGFPIENVSSFHLNVRDFEGGYYFIRVETVVEGPTYFVVFSDTTDLPPPFRIDNFSLVPIIVHQTNVGEERLKLTVKGESSVPYAWDEPTLPSNLTLAAPGGTSVIVKMDNSSLGLVAHMTYENFFYIALRATFPGSECGGLGGSGMETLQLVLDVPEGSKVVLRKKEAGNRNQLWRVNADGMIEHEGSSPPRDPRKRIPLSSLVLDIAGQATQPTQCVPLMLRKPDKRRSLTQHWEFTVDGRLKCKNLLNVYVQAMDGFGLLDRSKCTPEEDVSVATWQMWSEAVLGPDQPVCFTRTKCGIPVEQTIVKQKLRPGSGRISVYVDTDGPTRVLRIIDTEKPPFSFLNHTYQENSINVIPKMVLNLDLQRGLGLSVINCNPREELVYVFLSSLAIQMVDTREAETVNISVDNIQIDNQLQDAEMTVVIYMKKSTEPEDEAPAVSLKWKRLKTKLNAYLYKQWELRLKPLNIIAEEKLLLKMCQWLGFGTPNETNDDVDVPVDVQKALTNSTSLTSKRFYFGQLRIHLKSVRLSLLTASRLTPELAQIKSRLGLTLIRFEDTLVEFTDCVKQHPFETFDFLVASVLKHYRSELTSQALFVLGSVDFLGNPVGFVTDVSVGVSSLISEGSLDALVRNVTHGISNSAAKVTGSLGDGLTRTLTMDAKHEELRRTVWDGSGSSAPLTAGVKGLTIGVVGGLTSVFSQTYDGVVNDGFAGLVSGLGKGIVGAVTKPAVGVLDLASGVASAVRDSSRTSSRMLPNRIRGIRLATGNGGLLPPYSDLQAIKNDTSGYRN